MKAGAFNMMYSYTDMATLDLKEVQLCSNGLC